MEEELAIEFCVCGYLIFQDIWEAAIGKEIPGTQKADMLVAVFYLAFNIHVFYFTL